HGVHLSHYFTQRLKMSHEGPDPYLVNLRRRLYNVDQGTDDNDIPWGSISLNIYRLILEEANKKFGEDKFFLHGNDMELFKRWSTNTSIKNNYQKIESLIGEYGFVPLPPPPRGIDELHALDNNNNNSSLRSDGYEN